MGIDISLDCIIGATEQSNGYDNFLCFVCGFSWLFMAFGGFKRLWFLCVEYIFLPHIMGYINARIEALDLKRKGKKGWDIEIFREYVYNETFVKIAPSLEIEKDSCGCEKYPKISQVYLLYVLVVTIIAGIEIYFQKSGCFGMANLYVLIPNIYIIYCVVDTMVRAERKIDQEYMEDSDVAYEIWAYAEGDR